MPKHASVAFRREIDRLYQRRTHWLRVAVSGQRPGQPLSLKKAHVTKSIARLQGFAAVLLDLLTRAGYTRDRAWPPRRGGGGFVGNDPPTAHTRYCGAAGVAGFGVVDSAQSLLIYSVHLLGGEAGRQNCAAQPGQMSQYRYPLSVPTLTPPRGAMSFGVGSHGGGSSWGMESELRTTLSADSILFHYTAQLVAGGWKAEGKPAVAEGVAVQRFSFREGQESWVAAMVVTVVGDKRSVALQFSKVE